MENFVENRWARPSICRLACLSRPWLFAAAISLGIAQPSLAGLFDDGPSSSKNTPPSQTTTTPPPDSSDSTPPPSNSTPKPKPKPKPKPAKKATQAPADTAKIPVPTEAARKTAEKLVRDVMASDLAKARTPEAKAQVGAQMLQTAQTTAEPDSRFVLLRDAMLWASEGGDVDTALTAWSELSQGFEPDPLGPPTEPFDKFMRIPTISASDEGRLCDAVLTGMNEAIAVDRFDIARDLARFANAFAHKANDHDLSERASAMQSSVGACEAEYRRVASSFLTLKRTPEDPTANAAVGRYECLVKADWDKGLAKLIKGNNAALKAAATAELKPPASAAEQAAVADAWWDMAEGQPAAIQNSIRTHAAKWYALAANGLDGLSKLKANQRVAEMQAPAPQAVASAVKPASKQPKTPKPEPADSTAGPASFNSIMDVIQSVPAELYPASVTGWTDDRQQKINDALLQNASGKTGTFQVVVQQVLPEGKRAELTCRTVRVGKISVRIMGYFDADAAALGTVLRPGVACVVTGSVYFPRFEGMELVFYLEHCTIVRN